MDQKKGVPERPSDWEMYWYLPFHVDRKKGQARLNVPLSRERDGKSEIKKKESKKITQ